MSIEPTPSALAPMAAVDVSMSPFVRLQDPIDLPARPLGPKIAALQLRRRRARLDSLASQSPRRPMPRSPMRCSWPRPRFVRTCARSMSSWAPPTARRRRPRPGAWDCCGPEGIGKAQGKVRPVMSFKCSRDALQFNVSDCRKMLTAWPQAPVQCSML